MQQKLDTARVARLMQYHYEDQSMPVRKGWATFVYKLRVNTGCDAQYLSIKWGVDLEIVMAWIIMGRALHNFDTRSALDTSGSLASWAFELRWSAAEVHKVRCPCIALGSTEVTLSNF